MIDTHAHLDACDDEPAELLARARDAGVTRVVTIGTGIDSCRRALAIAESVPGVFTALGIDPHQAATAEAHRIADLRGLLGRAPADVAGRTPADVAGRTPAMLVPLTDDSMRISKTHAEFGVTDGRFWVADRASKTGTVVELPGGAERSLGAGERIELPVGSAVRLGGRRFTVERSTRG